MHASNSFAVFLLFITASINFEPDKFAEVVLIEPLVLCTMPHAIDILRPEQFTSRHLDRVATPSLCLLLFVALTTPLRGLRAFTSFSIAGKYYENSTL